MLSRFIPQHTELSPLPATQQSSKRIANESWRPTMKDETQSKQVLMLALGLITTGMGLAMWLIESPACCVLQQSIKHRTQSTPDITHPQSFTLTQRYHTSKTIKQNKHHPSMSWLTRQIQRLQRRTRLERFGQRNARFTSKVIICMMWWKCG